MGGGTLERVDRPTELYLWPTDGVLGPVLGPSQPLSGHLLGVKGNKT